MHDLLLSQFSCSLHFYLVLAVNFGQTLCKIVELQIGHMCLYKPEISTEFQLEELLTKELQLQQFQLCLHGLQVDVEDLTCHKKKTCKLLQSLQKAPEA